MDWGLLDRNAGENRLLREEIVYPRKVWVCALASGAVMSNVPPVHYITLVSDSHPPRSSEMVCLSLS